ncbi:hypothetical protein V1J52_19660 [Streptomyces sp. TRM 70351]|uniref:DUF7848 domain-containing protein n=1 Tax=Streptomyces sp. TRM 70351 TaxID=3116552 RepID=UPI002E7ABDFF|nr:hypothetical protein [Streptomyces sp. TRM 70351]MEE1930371.1 hypothetical protein [Streptomyces sp. TRM 70351]
MTTPIRRMFRFVNWTLRPDREADAPPLTYAFRCLALLGDDTPCDARSQTETDPAGPQEWAFGHLRQHPGHTSYAEVIERPWVMWRGEAV